MGAYINPTNGTKEQFLKESGTRISIEEFKNFDYEDKDNMPVCLMDNGVFQAAGIAYNKGENQAFTHEEDMRPKKYFLVSTSDVLKVSDLLMYL